MSDTPEKIWVTPKWAWALDLSEETDAAEYTRTDLSEAAIAAARADGVREGMLRAAGLIPHDPPYAEDSDPLCRGRRIGYKDAAFDAVETIRAAAGDAP